MYKILHIPSARYIYKYEPINLSDLTCNNSKYIQCDLKVVISKSKQELQNLLDSSTHYFNPLDNEDAIMLTAIDGYSHVKIIPEHFEIIELI